jgi:16S rRNA processing protein RimM
MDAENRLPKYIIIGRILKPHGVRGALKVDPLTDDPKRFDLLQTVYLGPEDEPVESFKIERVQYLKKQVVLSLQNINTFEDADQWRKKYVQIAVEDALTSAEDAHYYFELVGLAVYTDKNEFVGRVHDIVSYPANDIFVVHDNDDREILIPDVPAFIRDINIKEGKLTITPIDGLLN